jgi:stage IV sporulation protein FB
MLGNAGETEFDLRFYCFGVPVRVHPLFWVMGAFVVWQSTPEPRLKFLGVLCVFLSILVHEMGHAIVIRRYGIPSEIVLYGMGGYATSGHFSTWRRVWVSFAGPLAGFVLYGIVYGILIVVVQTNPDVLVYGHPVYYSIDLLLWINLYWGLMNLLPVIPLDGGRIMEALVSRYFPRRSQERVLQISILTAGAVCVYGLQNQRRFLIILFGLLCAQSVIAYNELKGSRRW